MVSEKSFDIESRSKPVILITGAGGEVGHGLITRLGSEGHNNLVALDLRELPSSLRKYCLATHVGDICDDGLMDRLFAMYNIKSVFHFAALLSTRAEFAPATAHAVNVGGLINVLERASVHGVSHGTRVKIIFPSSIAAYGFKSIHLKKDAGTVQENDFLEPVTMYGCNKVYCEQVGHWYGKHWRSLSGDERPIDFRCLRYPGLISGETIPSGGTSDYLPEMIHAAARGNEYECFVSEDTKIPFMTMPKAIEATLQLSEAPQENLNSTVYNIASFAITAGQGFDLLKKYYPNFKCTFNPDIRRSRIVNSWPENVCVNSASQDWGFSLDENIEEAFENYIIPSVMKRYSN